MNRDTLINVLGVLQALREQNDLAYRAITDLQGYVKIELQHLIETESSTEDEEFSLVTRSAIVAKPSREVN